MIAALLTEPASAERQQVAGAWALLPIRATCRVPCPIRPAQLGGQPDIQHGSQLTTGGVTHLVESVGSWQDVKKVVLEREEQIG